MVVYLDANVFLYAGLHAGPKSARASSVLADVVEGRERAVTASLTVDEVVWVYLDKTDRLHAVEQGRRILELPNLRTLDVTGTDIAMALELMERHGKLDPRDAIHAAVAVNAGVFTIVSDDEDFDEVDQLERRPLA